MGDPAEKPTLVSTSRPPAHRSNKVGVKHHRQYSRLCCPQVVANRCLLGVANLCGRLDFAMIPVDQFPRRGSALRPGIGRAEPGLVSGFWSRAATPRPCASGVIVVGARRTLAFTNKSRRLLAVARRVSKCPDPKRERTAVDNLSRSQTRHPLSDRCGECPLTNPSFPR